MAPGQNGMSIRGEKEGIGRRGKKMNLLLISSSYSRRSTFDVRRLFPVLCVACTRKKGQGVYPSLYYHDCLEISSFWSRA